MPKAQTNSKYERAVRDDLLGKGFPMVTRTAASGSGSKVEVVDLIAMGRGGAGGVYASVAYPIEVKSLKGRTYWFKRSHEQGQYQAYRRLYLDQGITVIYAVCFKGDGRTPPALHYFMPSYGEEGYPALSRDPAKVKRAKMLTACIGTFIPL